MTREPVVGPCVLPPAPTGRLEQALEFMGCLLTPHGLLRAAYAILFRKEMSKDRLEKLANELELHEGDADDVTRNHAGRGLEVIGEKARAFLFPETRVQHPKILELG